MLGPEWNIVTTPDKLREYYRAIAEGKTEQSLLVVGPTSTGKTEMARSIFSFVSPQTGEYPAEKNRHALYLDGGSSPAQLYTYAYKHIDRTLFIDDPTSAFVKTADGKRIWKQLFATAPRGRREITWHTKAHFIEQEELAPAFCNEFNATGGDIEAVKARAICVYYSPDLITRIKYAREWVEREKGGKEILKWVEDHYKRGEIRHIHQRHFYHALQFKRMEDSGLKTRDWKDYLAQATRDPDIEESPNVDADVSLLIRWAGEKTLCGVFTPANLTRQIRPFRDETRRDAAIEACLKRGLIHQIPSPPRPRGSRVRIAAVVYCLGPDPAKARVEPSLAVVTSEGVRTRATQATKATPKKGPSRVAKI
jgi:hypothetical protein